MSDTGDLKKKINGLVEEVTQETKKILSSRLSVLEKEISDAVTSSHVVSLPSESSMDLKDLKDASYSLKNAQGQNDIITAILNFAGTCVQRSAVFALKGTRLYGWQAVGLKADDPSQIVNIKKIVIDAKSDSPFSEVLKTTTPWIGKTISNPVLADLFNKLGGTEPKELCIFPLILKDRVIALLYGDNITSSQLMFQTDSLDIMSVIASLVMENVSLGRAKGTTGATALPTDGAVKGESEGVTRPMKPAPLPADMDDATRKLHEKARRTARVIVGDIALYNKEKITRGLAKGNLGALLSDDINKGRELYHQRVSTDITKNTNYFEDTLIDMIGKGNPKLLGL